MILEKIAVDFRCQGCSTIRRVDARITDNVSDLLPSDWTSEDVGVCCTQCATGASTRREKADLKREEVRKLRMPVADVTSLESPITAAVSPLVSDTCIRCHKEIGESESWRPDPEAAGFAKVHRQCLHRGALRWHPEGEK